MSAPRRKREIPFWRLAIILLGLLVAWLIASDGDYAVIFAALRQGVCVTLWVSVVAFAASRTSGLFIMKSAWGATFMTLRRLFTERASPKSKSW